MQRDAVTCNELSVVRLWKHCDWEFCSLCPSSQQCSSFYSSPSTQEHKKEVVREADYLESVLHKSHSCSPHTNIMCSSKSCDLQSHSAKYYPNPQVYFLSLSHTHTPTHFRPHPSHRLFISSFTEPGDIIHPECNIAVGHHWFLNAFLHLEIKYRICRV